MIKVFVATLAAALTSVNATAQTLEFKGVPFGADSDTVRERLYDTIQNWYCNDPSTSPLLADKTCFMGKSTYATRPVNNLRADFYAGRLGSLSMNPSPDDYLAIRAAISEKYGRPKETASIVSNAMGAKFQQMKAIWTPPGGMIVLERYATTISEGSLMISSNEYALEFARRQSAQPKPKSDI